MKITWVLLLVGMLSGCATNGAYEMSDYQTMMILNQSARDVSANQAILWNAYDRSRSEANYNYQQDLNRQNYNFQQELNRNSWQR